MVVPLHLGLSAAPATPAGPGCRHHGPISLEAVLRRDAGAHYGSEGVPEGGTGFCADRGHGWVACPQPRRSQQGRRLERSALSTSCDGVGAGVSHEPSAMKADVYGFLLVVTLAHQKPSLLLLHHVCFPQFCCRFLGRQVLLDILCNHRMPVSMEIPSLDVVSSWFLLLLAPGSLKTDVVWDWGH